MVILDTNIIIDHLRLENHTKISKLREIVKHRPKEDLAISVVTVQELYGGFSTKDSVKEQYLLATISPLKILPYTYEVAQHAGEIARDLDRPIGLADAVIAATTILNDSQLFTLDKNDFKDIFGLIVEDQI